MESSRVFELVFKPWSDRLHYSHLLVSWFLWPPKRFSCQITVKLLTYPFQLFLRKWQKRRKKKNVYTIVEKYVEKKVVYPFFFFNHVFAKSFTSTQFTGQYNRFITLNQIKKSLTNPSVVFYCRAIHEFLSDCECREYNPWMINLLLKDTYKKFKY